MYINDLTNYIESENVMLYADDTILYTTGKSRDQIQHKLQQILDATVKWTTMNKLTINTSKTKSILLNRLPVNRKPEIVLTVHDQPLEQVTSYKYLGYRLEDKLTFNPLLQDVIKSVHHKLYTLNKIRSCINARTALTIYKCKVLPCP